ncbi:MAG: hypothetical protein MdMp014T_3027 [Treponematales bacterium]
MKNFKKMAALWVVGCLAAAGSLFALDLGKGFTLGGEVVAGVKVVTNDDGDTSIAALYDDWGDTLPRLRLNAAWSNDVFGVKGRVQVTNGVPNGAFGFGWINFGKYATLYTGNIDDSHFGTGDVVFNKNWDSGTGLKLLIKPIEALTIGAYVPFDVSGTDASSAGDDIEDAFGNMTIGASFKHQVVSVTAAFGLVDDGTNTGIGLLYDVNAKPIPALGIDISGYLISGDALKGGLAEGFAIAPRITYSAGAISAYGQVKFLTYDAGDDDSDIDLEFQAKYTVGKFAPYLRFGLGVGDGDMDKDGARVRVGTPINLSDGLSFEVFEQIGGIASDAGIKNTFRAQIKYTF